MNGHDGPVGTRKLRKTPTIVPVAGRSARLPTYIDYSRNDRGPVSPAGVNDDGDDKHGKYRGGSWRSRLLGKANSSSGAFGALIRSAVRAGVLERRFWRQTLLSILLLSGLALFVFNRLYYTYIELAFFPRSWIKRAILPVPPLSGTCFSSPSSGYNTSLATSPHYLTLSPGIPMRYGLDCYHFSRQLPSVPIPGQILPETVIYHLYWRADLAPLTNRQILLLKSILLTQDPQHTSVILWTNAASLAQNPLLQPLLEKVGQQRFSVRVVDVQLLARGTPMEGHRLLTSSGGQDKRAWVDGDLVRVLLLYAMGGVWVDMDSVLLRDLRPLLEQEWVTQWDCYDKPFTVLNGAVMHFYPRSPYACEMLHIMATGPAPRPATTDWGSTLYYQLHRRLLQAGIKPFAVLPFCLMDARSCRLDNRLPDPFAKDDPWISTTPGQKELQMKVDSVFAIHLHNQWTKQFPKNGWMERMVVKRIDDAWNAL